MTAKINLIMLWFSLMKLIIESISIIYGHCKQINECSIKMFIIRFLRVSKMQGNVTVQISQIWCQNVGTALNSSWTTNIWWKVLCDSWSTFIMYLWLIKYWNVQMNVSLYWRPHIIQFTADPRLAPSQWETSLQSNDISHWLGANLESALQFMWPIWLKSFSSSFRYVFEATEYREDQWVCMQFLFSNI